MEKYTQAENTSPDFADAAQTQPHVDESYEEQGRLLDVEFSDHTAYEPDHPHSRIERAYPLPPTYPFIDRRKGERRHADTPAAQDRRHPEEGDRRQIHPVAFHVGDQPQDAPHKAVRLGALPFIGDQIFVEQEHGGTYTENSEG
jgi:hypothetical protein